MASLDERLAAVEQQVQELRHLAETGAPAAVSFGLSFVRDEVAELRRETRDGFAAVRTEMADGFSAVNGRLDGIDQALRTLLERG